MFFTVSRADATKTPPISKFARPVFEDIMQVHATYFGARCPSGVYVGWDQTKRRTEGAQRLSSDATGFVPDENTL